MAQALKIGIAGLGTVGASVVRLLAAQREALGPPRSDWWRRPKEWLRPRERIEEALRCLSRSM